MIDFELATAARVVFGSGKLALLPSLVHELGVRRVLLVTGRSPARAAAVLPALAELGIAVESFAVAGEPTVECARAGMLAAQASEAEAVIALGGGSALDTGKAIAALAANGGDPLDYLEVVGRGQPLTKPSLPLVAVPTTAGTGTEVTRNAVLLSPEHQVKASLRSASMLPRVALVDPDLLQGAPPDVMAASGMDALSQLIEPFVSLRANPLTDALARAGIVRSARSLRRACTGSADAAAREDLGLASLFGGLCLANAGLGAVHGFAAPAGGMLDAPHGALCAAVLPFAFEVNARAVRERGGDDEPFREVAALVTGNPAASIADGVAWLDALRRDLWIPALAHYGLTRAQIPLLVERAKKASSMRGNPVTLSDAQLTEIANRAL